MEQKYQNFVRFIHEKKHEKAQQSIQSRADFEKKKQSVILTKERETEEAKRVIL
jgi:hypothetical protein